MAIKITEDCIDCGTCEPECPNEAIKGAGPLTPQRAAPRPLSLSRPGLKR
ncbi:4Fe-4S binding protein [Streptomyces sp. HB202]|nr:4Fe-4S binding protein [Streptomyces sp. HB202]RDL03085.1 4Fe-4S binding protein [Streptomyces sp. HB202]